MARSAVRLFGCSAAWLLGCLAVWMFGCPPPCWLRLRRGGCGVSMGVGAPMLRELTRRGCLSGARQRKASSTAHLAAAPPQVCPFATRRGRRLGGAFSLVTFFWRSKRKLLARRATPGLRPQHRQAAQSAQRPDTTKSIATTAYPTSASSPKALKQAPKPSAPKKSPTHPSHAASPPGCAPPAWRHNKPCPPHTTPTAHPASWRPAPPARCSPPA